MATTSDVITLNIEISASSVSQTGFGTPLIYAYHAYWPEAIREFAEVDELVDLGVDAAHPIMVAAVALKSQTPKPATFKVGLRSQGFTHKFTIQVKRALRTGTVISGVLGGLPWTYTVLVTDTTATLIATGIKNAIDALANAAATSSTDTVTVTASATNTVLQLTGIDPVAASALSITDTTVVTAQTQIADFAEIRSVDDDWYGVVTDLQVKADTNAIQAYLQTIDKIGVFQTADGGCLDVAVTDDVISTAKTAAYDQSIICWHHEIGTGHAAAMLGKALPYTPGQITWAHKTLAGTSTSKLSPAEINVLISKRGNYYTTKSGGGHTMQGITGRGIFIDTMTVKHWLQARIVESVIGTFRRNLKIPFSNDGINLMISAVHAPLDRQTKIGGLLTDPAPVVTAPTVQQISPADREARRLPDVSFLAYDSGAIHGIVIQGKVSVTLPVAA
jgi:hypothetical protein